MARRVKTSTIKSGNTANDRRVLVSVSTTGTAPAAATEGYILQQNEYVHVLFGVGGTSPVFRVRLYWYFDVSGKWHKGHQVVVNGDDCMLIEAQGAQRLALVVEGVSGTSPTLNAWVALARPV